MHKKQSGSSVASVTVTFNPDLKTLQRQLAQVSPQVGRVFLVDNGSSNAKEINYIAESIAHVRVIFCQTNLGLGRAQNIGIRACRDEGMTMVLLLDQDSIPRNGMVETLVTASNQLIQVGEKVAAVGACYTGSHTGHPSFFVQFKRFRFQKCFCNYVENDQIIPADMLISSGSLIPILALDTIGEMDEKLFIDHIDTEWSLRARSLGWQSYGVCNALMEHHLGEHTFRVWWGRWRYVSIHQPFRYYYIYRNSILLHQRSYADPLWKQADQLRLLLITMFVVLFSNQRLSCIKMIVRGVTDAIRRKTGPINSH
jgi:rhamnosyltransferase